MTSFPAIRDPKTDHLLTPQNTARLKPRARAVGDDGDDRVPAVRGGMRAC